MPHTTGKRYAVVSCHVERPLHDEAWRRFLDLQARRPGGFRIAALVRPPDAAAGEDETAWLERARAAATLGPFGQHTHWTAPDHARPTFSLQVGNPLARVPDRKIPKGGRFAAASRLPVHRSGGTGERVLAEGARLRELGLGPTLFCGGGWYTDAEVAEACAELGYVDCTPRASRPPYLGPGEAWASLAAPARVRLPSGRTLGAIPTTHSLGDLARTRGRALPGVVHLYFHDTDLLDLRRRMLVRALLPLLARLAEPTDLDALARELLPLAPELEWAEMASD